MLASAVRVEDRKGVGDSFGDVGRYVPSGEQLDAELLSLFVCEVVSAWRFELLLRR